jgi:hypothetical protein
VHDALVADFQLLCAAISTRCAQCPTESTRCADLSARCAAGVPFGDLPDGATAP